MNQQKRKKESSNERWKERSKKVPKNGRYTVQKVKNTCVYNECISWLYAHILESILLVYSCVQVRIGTLYMLCYTVRYSLIILYCVCKYTLCITSYTIAYTSIIRMVYSTVFLSIQYCTHMYTMCKLSYTYAYTTTTGIVIQYRILTIYCAAHVMYTLLYNYVFPCVYYSYTIIIRGVILQLYSTLF